MRRHRILVVDDDAVVRMTLGASLELEGFEVVEATCGEAALALAKETTFDLVLSDIRMPGMDGGELLGKLKELRPETPVVLMTAYAHDDVVQDATQKGVFAVLTKPFEVEEASRMLARAIEKPVVLIIDDTEPFATSMVEALKVAGLRARAVLNGKAALEEIVKSDIDICVVDLVMSGLSGPEVVDKLRDIDGSLSIIAISGHSVPELIAQALRNGAAQFMRKPFRPSDLLSLIVKLRGESVRVES